MRTVRLVLFLVLGGDRLFVCIELPLAHPFLGFGDLDRPTTKRALIEKIKKTFKLDVVGIIGSTSGKVRRAAVCAGSCGSMLRNVIANQCDFYLTGELKHHFALELQEAGVTTVCLSHTNSERIVLPKIAQTLCKRCKSIECIISKKDKDPFRWN